MQWLSLRQQYIVLQLVILSIPKDGGCRRSGAEFAGRIPYFLRVRRSELAELREHT
jgi:hypothetical protein